MPHVIPCSAVLHAVHAAKRWELCNIMFFAMLKAKIGEPQVLGSGWLLGGAGRAGGAFCGGWEFNFY